MNAKERLTQFQTALDTDKQHIAHLAGAFLNQVAAANLVVEVRTNLVHDETEYTVEVNPNYYAARRLLELQTAARRYDELKVREDLTPAEQREMKTLEGSA